MQLVIVFDREMRNWQEKAMYGSVNEVVAQLKAGLTYLFICYIKCH